MTQDQEIIRFLIEQKLIFINTTLSICMLWWVSAVVFSGSTLAGVWLREHQIMENSKVIPWLGVILCVFFTSIIGFGVMIFIALWNIEIEINELALKLALVPNFYSTELIYFRIGIAIGTGSFILVLFAWIWLWNRLAQGAKIYNEGKEVEQKAKQVQV
jgi:hypothetical protein